MKESNNSYDAKQKASSTLRSSRAVPHPSTNRALRRLTSEFGRDPVHSTRYGRWQQFLLMLVWLGYVFVWCRGKPKSSGRSQHPHGRTHRGTATETLHYLMKGIKLQLFMPEEFQLQSPPASAQCFGISALLRHIEHASTLNMRATRMKKPAAP